MSMEFCIQEQLYIAVKLGSQYDASQRVRKNRTNFYSSVWVQTGARRHASVGNGSEPASSELRVATRHIVNLALCSIFN